VFSPDSRRIACVGADFCVCDATTGRRLTAVQALGQSVTQVSFSPDGNRLLGIVDGRAIRIWDAATGEPVGLPLRAGGETSFARFTADGRHVVTAGRQGARSWSVGYEARPLAYLLPLARLMSGQNITPRGEIVSEDANQLRADWLQLAGH
jgi:WD40 repeat protein